ncbi:class II aldolase/adducin family protein [Phenylobacterium sp.]|uniref:class II aldolase/adducin family protein n=1 Tax=Phenylobacterium sp. TaxID=1871053 RepID=UPI002F4187C3
MADGGQLAAASLKGLVSDEEWRLRVDLAALYRLTALNGWDSGVATHISVRAPGPEHHFLINPFGWFFEEITASSLVKIDLDGDIVRETPYKVNPARFVIHSAIHMSRPDAACVIHLHTDAGVAVASQTEGLLPITQFGAISLERLAYHDFEGVALNLGERERLVADLGDKTVMLLRHHGALAVGPTPAEAWSRMVILETACRQQIMALSVGRGGVRNVPQAAIDMRREQFKGGKMGREGTELAWPAYLRRLNRTLPGYDV